MSGSFSSFLLFLHISKWSDYPGVFLSVFFWPYQDWNQHCPTWALSHSFCFYFGFQTGPLAFAWPALAQDPPISTSWVAGIKGMYQCTWLWCFLYLATWHVVYWLYISIVEELVDLYTHVYRWSFLLYMLLQFRVNSSEILPIILIIFTSEWKVAQLYISFLSWFFFPGVCNVLLNCV
jgi:hypothetical protein